MTKKKQRTIRMREIRKATGLPLPVAAELAKLKEFMSLPEKLRHFLVVTETWCDTCRTNHDSVTAYGKKGSLKLY